MFIVKKDNTCVFLYGNKLLLKDLLYLCGIQPVWRDIEDLPKHFCSKQRNFKTFNIFQTLLRCPRNLTSTRNIAVFYLQIHCLIFLVLMLPLYGVEFINHQPGLSSPFGLVLLTCSDADITLHTRLSHLKRAKCSDSDTRLWETYGKIWVERKTSWVWCLHDRSSIMLGLQFFKGLILRINHYWSINSKHW